MAKCLSEGKLILFYARELGLLIIACTLHWGLLISNSTGFSADCSCYLHWWEWWFLRCFSRVYVSMKIAFASPELFPTCVTEQMVLHHREIDYDQRFWAFRRFWNGNTGCCVEWRRSSFFCEFQKKFKNQTRMRTLLFLLRKEFKADFSEINLYFDDFCYLPWSSWWWCHWQQIIEKKTSIFRSSITTEVRIRSSWFL